MVTVDFGPGAIATLSGLVWSSDNKSLLKNLEDLTDVNRVPAELPDPDLYMAKLMAHRLAGTIIENTRN